MTSISSIFNFSAEGPKCLPRRIFDVVVPKALPFSPFLVIFGQKGEKRIPPQKNQTKMAHLIKIRQKWWNLAKNRPILGDFDQNPRHLEGVKNDHFWKTSI